MQPSSHYWHLWPQSFSWRSPSPCSQLDRPGPAARTTLQRGAIRCRWSPRCVLTVWFGLNAGRTATRITPSPTWWWSDPMANVLASFAARALFATLVYTRAICADRDMYSGRVLHARRCSRWVGRW
ncbi:hypothetical protein ACU4GD_42360 [Cupriavidus basilensis]